MSEANVRNKKIKLKYLKNINWVIPKSISILIPPTAKDMPYYRYNASRVTFKKWIGECDPLRHGMIT